MSRLGRGRIGFRLIGQMYSDHMITFFVTVGFSVVYVTVCKNMKFKMCIMNVVHMVGIIMTAIKVLSMYFRLRSLSPLFSNTVISENSIPAESIVFDFESNELFSVFICLIIRDRSLKIKSFRKQYRFGLLSRILDDTIFRKGCIQGSAYAQLTKAVD